LLPFPIYDKVFRCETTFLLTRLPAGIHPRWSHQVYPVGFLTGDRQFGVVIAPSAIGAKVICTSVMMRGSVSSQVSVRWTLYPTHFVCRLVLKRASASKGEYIATEAGESSSGCRQRSCSSVFQV
jgi:hypothetical protein